MTKQTYSYGIQVHCTVSNDPSITTTDWFFANGSKVGLVDSNFREGHYNNGTTVLQIGIGRRLTYCDGGNYTCVVNTTSGSTEKRSFHLLIRSMLIFTPHACTRGKAISFVCRHLSLLARNHHILRCFLLMCTTGLACVPKGCQQTHTCNISLAWPHETSYM